MREGGVGFERKVINKKMQKFEREGKRQLTIKKLLEAAK